MVKATENQLDNDALDTIIEQNPGPAIFMEIDKKKKKYSKSKRDIQEFEIGMTKANLRIAKAVYKGLQTWEKERDSSAEKQRNGALRDALKNSGKSLRKSLRIASGAPSDILDALAELKPTKRLLKLL